jgi:hypothetical protein
MDWLMLTVTLVFGVLGLFLEKFGRNIKHFAIARENQQLKVSLSRSGILYYSSWAALVTLWWLSMLITFIILHYSPHPEVKRIIARVVTGCGVSGFFITGTLVALVVFGARNVYTFDRPADRVLKRKKLLCRIGQIAHIQIDRDGQRANVRHDLSMVLRDGKRRYLYGAGVSADELVEVASTISDYLGVPLKKPESQ